jgi:hypothetical protein
MPHKKQQNNKNIMKREFLNYKTTKIWRFFFFFDQLQVSWHESAGCSGLK